jgi:hypothetical protein
VLFTEAYFKYTAERKCISGEEEVNFQLYSKRTKAQLTSENHEIRDIHMRKYDTFKS